MAKRRPRLVPKVVFRVALTATAVPLLAGCAREPLTVANRGFSVAVAYAPDANDSAPVADASSALPPPPGVAAPAYVNPPPIDASADVKVDAAKLDAGKLDAGKVAAASKDASVAGPSLTAHPPMPGVASRGYDVVGVAYRGYDLPKPSAGGVGPGAPPTKP